MSKQEQIVGQALYGLSGAADYVTETAHQFPDEMKAEREWIKSINAKITSLANTLGAFDDLKSQFIHVWKNTTSSTAAKMGYFITGDVCIGILEALDDMDGFRQTPGWEYSHTVVTSVRAAMVQDWSALAEADTLNDVEVKQEGNVVTFVPNK